VGFFSNFEPCQRLLLELYQQNLFYGICIRGFSVLINLVENVFIINQKLNIIYQQQRKQNR